MRLAIVGATGWLGGLVAAEALNRGHSVTAVVRDPGRADRIDSRARVAVAKLGDPEGLDEALSGHDAVLSAYRAPADTPGEMPAQAGSLLTAARRAGVRRIVWIGGTAVLETPDGSGDIVDLPAFPEDWRAAGLAHRETLNAFRSEGVDLDWTYVCPPTGIAPGERTGVYRVGVDRLLVDEEGQSTVSAEDFAVGVADLLESGDHVRERVTIAY
jgi:putative NADH-flavin reductase